MIIALLIIHAFVTIAMVGLILLQKSDGSVPFGAGGGGGSLFTARGAANILTRTTAILAAVFIGNCILIGVLTDREVKKSSSIFTQVKKKLVESPVEDGTPAKEESSVDSNVAEEPQDQPEEIPSE